MVKKESQTVHELEAQVETLMNDKKLLDHQRVAEKTQMQSAIEQEKLAYQRIAQETEQLRKENAAYLDEIQVLQNEKTSLNQQIENYQGIQLGLQQELSQTEDRLTETIEKLETEIKTRKACENDIISLKKIVREKDGTIEKLKHSEEKHAKELKSAVQKMNELEVKAAQEQVNRDNLTFALREEITGLESRLQEKSTHGALNRKEHEDEMHRCEEELKQAKKTIQQLREEIVFLSVSSSEDASKDEHHFKNKVLALQRELHEKSEAMVAQGEKALVITEKSFQLKESLEIATKEIQRARQVLLVGIAGPEVDASFYQHVRLEELIRLRVKAFENDALRAKDILSHHQDRQYENGDDANIKEGDDRAFEESKGEEGDGNMVASAATSAGNAHHQPSTSILKEGREVLGSIGKLEREMRVLRSRNKRLQDRVEHLESELQSALAVMDDVKALREKAAELAGRQRTEKDLRYKSETAVQEAGDKVALLSEHIEKLMVHLKHEAASKAKTLETHRRAEKEIQSLKEEMEVLSVKNAAKDKFITELEAGSKILEDQLRLMDEKYIVLRKKLDYSRQSSEKQLKKIESESNILRGKWQLAIESGQIKEIPEWSDILNSPKKTPSKGKQRSSSNIRRNQLENPPDVIAAKLRDFEIPQLPQTDLEKDTPWSDAKLTSLQRQTKQQSNFQHSQK